MALWIEIAVILNWRYGMVWFGMVRYGLVWFCCLFVVWYGGEGGQMTSEFINEEISIMDCNGLS